MGNETLSPCSSWGPWSWRYRGTSWSGSCVACLWVQGQFHGINIEDPGAWALHFVRKEALPRRCHGGRGKEKKNFYKGWKRTLLARRLLDLGGGTNADQTVGGLKLLQGLGGVVDQSEAGGLATTVLGAETEDGDLVLVGLVQVGQLLAELILGDVGAVGVQDVTGNEEK